MKNILTVATIAGILMTGSLTANAQMGIGSPVNLTEAKFLMNEVAASSTIDYRVIEVNEVSHGHKGTVFTATLTDGEGNRMLYKISPFGELSGPRFMPCTTSVRITADDVRNIMNEVAASSTLNYTVGDIFEVSHHGYPAYAGILIDTENNKVLYRINSQGGVTDSIKAMRY